MKKLFLIIAMAVCASTLSAQNYFPSRVGAELIYKYYDRNGKPLKDEWKNVRWMRFVVEDTGQYGNGTVINVGVGNETIERLTKSEMMEQVAKNLSYGDVKIWTNSVSFDNLQWLVDVVPEFFLYIPPEIQEGRKYRVELCATTSFPKEMTVGSTLPDEQILNIGYYMAITEEQRAKRKKELEEIEIETGQRIIDSDYPLAVITARIRNRKVEAFEKVTTPAGTFDCYKITFELLKPNRLGIDFFMSLATSGLPDSELMDRARREETFKCTDWISPQVGFVKREIYNDRGKLQEVMLLESYKK